jgi:hypothetical protein
MQVAAEIDHEAFLVGAAHRHQELDRFTTLDFRGATHTIADVLPGTLTVVGA